MISTQCGVGLGDWVVILFWRFNAEAFKNMWEPLLGDSRLTQ